MTRGYHNLPAIPPGHSLEGFFAPEVDISCLIGSWEMVVLRRTVLVTWTVRRVPNETSEDEVPNNSRGCRVV